MKKALLFVVSVIVTAVSAVIGSMGGHFFGSHLAVMLVGTVGGLIGASVSGRLAVARDWITGAQYLPTTIGTAIGFLAADFIAAKTLSSPVGPILSTFLIGIGAVVGAAVGARPQGGSGQN